MSDTLKEIFFSVSKWIHQNRENHFPTSQGIYPSAIAGNLYYHLHICLGKTFIDGGRL